MKKSLFAFALLASTSLAGVQAADYVVDTKGAHASINFKIQHLGYSWLTGRFNEFSGNFSYDDNNVAATKIHIEINPASIDTNHAERNKHLKSKNYLNVAKFANASFDSTKVTDLGEGKLQVEGNLTMHGMTKAITIMAEKVGEGKDPWGGYRAGFAGTTELSMQDFGIKNNFGKLYFDLHLEGIRQ